MGLWAREDPTTKFLWRSGPQNRCLCSQQVNGWHKPSSHARGFLQNFRWALLEKFRFAPLKINLTLILTLTLTILTIPSGHPACIGPDKPRTGCTGQCMNHAPAILATPALIYDTHRVLVVSITVTHFHLCSLLGTQSCYTVLEVWAVRQPMRVCCGSCLVRCMLSINILDSLTAPCFAYTAGAVTVMCDGYMVHTLAGVAGAWFIRTHMYRISGNNAVVTKVKQLTAPAHTIGQSI